MWFYFLLPLYSKFNQLQNNCLFLNVLNYYHEILVLRLNLLLYKKLPLVNAVFRALVTTKYVIIYYFYIHHIIYNSYKNQLISDIHFIVGTLACLIHKYNLLLGSILKFGTDQTNIEPQTSLRPTTQEQYHSNFIRDWGV